MQHTTLEQLRTTLSEGPGAVPRSDRHKAVRRAILEAGKRWATSAVPDGGRGWREQLEPLVRPYLGHPSADLRGAAIRTLASYWTLPAHRAAAHRLMREDPDDGVRATATDGWVEYARNTNDAGVLAELAAVLRNRREPDELRTSAYRGVLAVSGYLDRLSPVDASNLLDVFEDVDGRVDWDLVIRLVPPATADR